MKNKFFMRNAYSLRRTFSISSMGRVAMCAGWAQAIFLLSAGSAGALWAQDQKPLRMMLASEAWRDAVPLLMSHGASAADLISDQMHAAIRRRDLTACQRILEVAASDKQWMARVAQLALVRQESEDARHWLLVNCSRNIASGVHLIVSTLSQSDLESVVLAASAALLTPGVSESDAMENLFLLALARLQLMRLVDASGKEAAQFLYGLLWTKDWTDVRVARRLIMCDVAWVSLVDRLAADGREASVAHASAVDRVINALSGRGTEAAWEVLDDVRPTIERLLLLASRQEADASTLYGLMASLLLGGDVGRIAAERLGRAAPMLSPDMAILTLRAWPSEASWATELIGFAKSLSPEVLRASRDALKRAAERVSSDCVMHVSDMLKKL
jgi:hypothetical protein